MSVEDTSKHPTKNYLRHYLHIIHCKEVNIMNKLITIALTILLLTTITSALPSVTHLDEIDCRNCHHDISAIHHTYDNTRTTNDCLACHNTFSSDWRDCNHCHTNFDHHDYGNDCNRCHEIRSTSYTPPDKAGPVGRSTFSDSSSDSSSPGKQAKNGK